jgi:hypothetical protein
LAVTAPQPAGLKGQSRKQKAVTPQVFENIARLKHLRWHSLTEDSVRPTQIQMIKEDHLDETVG